MSGGTTRRVLIGVIVGCAGVILAALAIPLPDPAAGAEPQPGDAGTDISLPATDSATTVHGRGAFADMEVTVNQTEDLTNQAISVTWTGAPPTVSEPTTFHSNFVQVMQCWGEPDDAVPENPGPPPEQCVWGALIPQGGQPTPGFAHAYTTSRAFDNQAFPNFDPTIGTVDAISGDVYRDFVAVDGTVVTDHVDASATDLSGQFWQNPYFDPVKTNELPGVRTLGNGEGQAIFTVNTGLESSGLGCGQRVQPNPGGQPTVPRCWLVIVPRGTPEDEQDGLPFQLANGVVSSPLSPGNWPNRIAVELGFTPVDSACDINADQRRLNGTEVALIAVGSWQQALCGQPGLPPYAFGVVPDQLARQQLLSDSPGAPGMIAVGRPLPPSASTAEDPIVYAPLLASAITIGFHLERVSATGGGEPLVGVRYERMNLTPRLVAKLLTQSYRSQVQIEDANFLDFQAENPYDWDDDNPLALFTDPDFLQFNPEFALWSIGSPKNAGGLILPAGTSDVASLVWEWILADPEAAAWLAGQPDEWGMAVNPVYATTAENNSTGFAFGEPLPDSFPKSDSYCYQAPRVNIVEVPPVLCGLDWMPYSQGLGEAARRTAVANDGSRTFLNIFAGLPHEVWKSTGTLQLGRRTMMGLTDGAALTRFGLQAVALSRPGDAGSDRQFVAPDEEGLDRAVQSMSDEGGLLRLDPEDIGVGAYPLTTLTYAAVRPLALDAGAREQYAAFLDYAAGPGQVLGHDVGQLPPGYLPLPADLAAQTTAAAALVRTLQPPTPATTPSTQPPATSGGGGSTSSSGSSGGGISSSGGATADATAPVAAPALPVIVAPTEPESAGMTPITAVGVGRYGVIGVASIAMLTAYLALEITKRPRRRSDGGGAPTTPRAAPENLP